ncbi:YDG domain-containing protein [Waltera sp.]|uniref:YDG domain-containing protein n=1 Tax=Waltera sp. TaxID=2815806 RepID=UPI003AB94C44
MKKRVLSMLLAFILCFSTLPMTAIAQEADAVTEQEADSAEEQEEAEAAAAPEAETSSDKSTTVETPGTEDSTAGEAPDKSVSDSDAGTQDTGADDEKKAAVQKVQALIDALPETVTVENAESVSAQLEAIDEAMAELTEEQREELDMTRLHAISEVLNTPMTVPMTVAEGQHVDHPICGATCTDENNHSIVTEWQPIGSETELKAATEGYYYLTQDIVTTGTWEPNNNVVLCLNGHSIAANGDFGVIEIKGANRQFTLCDCNSSASTHYFIKSVENNLTRWVPCEENTENRISVTGGVITHSVRTSDLGVKVDKNATFTMYGGTICGNKLQGSYNGAGVYVHDSTFNMYGGAIRGNAASWGGGVAALGSTFNMYGGVISDNMVSASAGGVLLSDKSVMNMSGNAQISNNIAPTKWTTSGGGVYIFASTDGEVSNCLYMSDNAKISGNTATSGGAVYVRKNGQVTMSGNAQISNNTATENGGGVYVENSTFKIAGGAPRVCDNLCQDVQNNVYLATGNAIRISKLSTFTGKIGVSTQDTPTGSNLVTVAAAAVESGAVGSLTEEYVDHISSDKENLYPVLVNGEVKLSATVPHRHPVCGETCGDSGKHSNQTWIGVSRLSDIKSSGNYYLTDNVTLDETWNCNISVNLCLNGKTITGAAGEETIRVAKGTTLTITDCQNEVGKITHAQDNIGRGIMSLGTLILYNGEITKNQIAKGSGAGVYVDGGNFYMYKGSISDNKVTINGNGGGVYAKDSTNFVISGGSIDSNHAPSSGGGIYYESTISKSVKFNISGGNIVRNTAVTGNGGGIWLKSAYGNMRFTMSGGRISNNVASKNGGGVYISEPYYGKFTVSSTAQITDNAGNGNDNNVYLPSGKTILIGSNGLDSSAKIGVTMGQVLDTDKYVAIAKGASNDYTLTANDLNAFNSDIGYKRYALDNAVNFSNGELHVHRLCGTANCTLTYHENVLWTAINTEAELRAIKGGTDMQYYYLTDNIKLNDTSWNPTGFISLCLNGHSITANGNFDAITVGSEDSSTAGDLHVCDCTGNGKITHAEDKTGRGVYVHPRSSFHLWGGSITGNSTNDCGGGVYLNGGFGYLSGGSITNNSANEGGGVAIRTASFHNPDTQNSRISGYFYMYGGTITGNTATNGGGVAVKDKTSFRTFGGSVIGNTATANGGGVYVESSTANMSVDGTADHTGDVNITGNKDAKGNDSNVYLPGGTNISIGQNVLHNIRIGVTLEKLPAEGNFVKFVEAATGVTLTDKIAGGFTIDNNSSNTYSVQNIDNSLYVVNGALHKHAICGASCSHETKHDDVLWTPLTYNADTQKMMCGGTIVSSSNGTKGMEYVLPTGNYYLLDNITFTGTIKISGDVNLCLNGKCITNLAQNYASTIAVLARGNLTLCDHEDGTITSKDQKSYGVQFKAYNGIPKFTMYGGTITGTDAGVCQDASAGVFNMYGGAITGNRVGADIPAEITMTVGGTARIIGNTKKDVFLYEKDENSKSIIHIDPSLTNAASIGVATTNSPRPKAPVQIATGATGLVDYTKIFKPDNTDRGYMVIKDAQGNLYLSAHQHSWQYTLGADGKSITATCVNTTNCPNIDGGSVTIKAPEENTLIYDGSNKKAILENKLLTGEKDPTISYTVGNGQGATLPDGSYPTNVGAYTASITVGGVTASVTYEIQKADPAAKNFVFTAPGSLTYDGMAKTADIKTATNITGMGDVMVKYYQGETEVQPMNAGEYKVKISVAYGSNFNAASDLTDENWAFRITPIITEPTVELSGNTTYTYTGERITPDVTVTIDGRPLTKGTDYTIIYGDNVNAGTNAGFVTVKAKGNYGFADVVKKFAIEKADPKLSFEKSTVTTSYGTQPANNKLTNMGNGVVTYQSNDNSVATVNEKGEVTVVGVGETTITATAAETKNYKLGTASYTLTVNKARVHIVQATVANKEYDGSVNADVTGVVFANEADVRIDSLVAGMDYTVTGAFQSENAGKQDAEVTVKLLGEFASHYELTGGTYKTRATITAKPISIATARTQDRSYERNNTSVTILEVTFKDSTNTLVATLTSSDYTATGKMVNANVGTDKKVTVTVTLQGKAADNYKLVSNMTTAKVAITQAKGGVLQEENLKQKFSDRKQKTFTPDYTGLPAGETWTYSISEAQTSGSAKVEPAMINTAGKITYRLTAGAENDTICWTVTISNPNYKNFTKDLVLTLTAKEPQETLRITGDNTVVYGQKLQLSTVGGSGTGEITYKVDEVRSTGDATIDENGVLTPVKVGSVVITATKAGDVDYSEITSAPFVIMITQAATSGEPKYHKITTGGKTLADAGLTLAGSTIHPADGTLEWIDDAGVLPNDTAVDMNKTYKWRFTPADTNYEILTGEIELYHVDAPAVTAQPKSVSVTVGDTATFEVTATGTDVTYQWQIDRNDGKGFVDITGATGATYTIGVTDRDCNGFKYRCVLSNAAGSVTTDTVVLTVQYQIIEGANGSWNQNTDGRSLKIRGNGEYSKFQNVKVDGNIIDSKNYTVSEGSTIIELHADYLKTLSEGSHTFEIVWTDGAAGTSFTVARNTSGSNNTGSNNTGNNDNNDSTDNSAAAAPTAAATAQELDKVPATGDPLGIWLTLFAISLTGLAGMLARRKKN